jgi:hypothetical protein
VYYWACCSLKESVMVSPKALASWVNWMEIGWAVVLTLQSLALMVIVTALVFEVRSRRRESRHHPHDDGRSLMQDGQQLPPLWKRCLEHLPGLQRQNRR